MSGIVLDFLPCVAGLHLDHISFVNLLQKEVAFFLVGTLIVFFFGPSPNSSYAGHCLQENLDRTFDCRLVRERHCTWRVVYHTVLSACHKNILAHTTLPENKLSVCCNFCKEKFNRMFSYVHETHRQTLSSTYFSTKYLYLMFVSFILCLL